MDRIKTFWNLYRPKETRLIFLTLQIVIGGILFSREKSISLLLATLLVIVGLFLREALRRSFCDLSLPVPFIYPTVHIARISDLPISPCLLLKFFWN